MSGPLMPIVRGGMIVIVALLIAGCPERPVTEVTTTDLAADTELLVTQLRAELQELKDRIDGQKEALSLKLVSKKATLNLSVATQKTESGGFALSTTIGKLTPSGGIEGKTDDTLTKEFVLSFETAGITLFKFGPEEKGADGKREGFVLADALWDVRQGMLKGLSGKEDPSDTKVTITPTCLTATVEFKAVKTRNGKFGINLLIVSFDASTARSDTGIHSISVEFGRVDKDSC